MKKETKRTAISGKAAAPGNASAPGRRMASGRSNTARMVLSVLLLVLFVLSLCRGRYQVSIGATVRIVSDKVLRILSFGKLGLTQTWLPREEIVVLCVRFPRVLAAMLIGAALSVAGAAYQGMFRNPMVSPDLLGASTGAGFGAALAILLGGSYLSISLSSFGFGLLAVFLAYWASRKSRMQTTVALILAGVMISSLFSAGTSFVKLVADGEDQLPAITYWLMGSLASVQNKDVLFAAVPIIIGLVPLLLLRWRINLLTVSEAEARSMGVNTDRLRLIVILCATLMTAGSVAISGMIGWVGLVIPHFCRILFGQDFRRLIPSAALMGAEFLLLVDTFARNVSTAEIPLGILTAFVGAPVFLWLLLKGGKNDA